MVSVALAVYNGEKFLREQVRSILEQTHSDLELVVVDDASQDDSWRTVRELAKNDSRIRFFRNEKNLGLVPNFLKAVSLCRGEQVCFSDQDDVWRRDKVELLSRIMAAHEKNMLVFSDLALEKGESFWEASKIQPKKGFLWPEALLRNTSPGCAMMFARPVADLLAKAALDPRFTSKGRLDDTLFMHDHLAFVFAAQLGRIDLTPEKLLRYRQHDANNIGANYVAEKGRQHMIDGFRAQIAVLKSYLPVDDKGLSELEAFTDSLVRPPFINAPGLWKYYQSLRRDTLREKGLGWAEGVFPGVFQKMREVMK